MELYKKSGHWEHYKDSMFPPMALGEHDELVLRPMCCPHHISVYSSKLRSYRDLPVRIAELGTMYRYEKSGVVGGLSRVRCMTLNDAHLFCRPDQVKAEFAGVLRLMKRAYATLGITEYASGSRSTTRTTRRSTSITPRCGRAGESFLRNAMTELGLPFFEATGEAAFYGPKIDVQVKDVLGREETLSTIQVDQHLPEQFELEYKDEDDTPQRPVMIHRGVISTMERMMAYLIELYAGAFPAWLAPVQAMVVPIADRHFDYGHEVLGELRAAGLPRGDRRAQRADEREDPRGAAAEDPVHARDRRQRGGGAGRRRPHARGRGPGVDAGVPVHRPAAGRGGRGDGPGGRRAGRVGRTHRKGAEGAKELVAQLASVYDSMHRAVRRRSPRRPDDGSRYGSFFSTSPRRCSRRRCWTESVRSPRVFSRMPRTLSVVRRRPPVIASG